MPAVWHLNLDRSLTRRALPGALLLLALVAGAWLARPAPIPPPVISDFARAAPSTAGACAAPANPIAAENCRPGSADWQIKNDAASRTPPSHHLLEGFASAASVQAGDDLRFYVNTDTPAFDLLIFRSGYYGGLGGRLLRAARGLAGRRQPACRTDRASGLTSCANWAVSYQMAVPDDWPSGVYLARLARPDDPGENELLFVVRDERRPAPLLVQLSVATQQAYNSYGGKSLYTFNSPDGCPTVSGAARAVAVSFDRPLAAPRPDAPNTYRYSDQPFVYWLEAQGYDLAYATDVDAHRWGQPGAPNGLLAHRALLVVGHDEYWSAEQRAAVTAARDAGVNLGFFSSNTAYWRVRYAPDPWTGAPDRVLVSYKTTESGGPDPSGAPSGTWRDPLGAGQPENALVGVQYVGDNSSQNFPLRVSAAQARDRLYRHTGLGALPPGSAVDLGQNLVGWEWDAAADNGQSPPGLAVLAETPVLGTLLTDAGRHTRLAAARAQVTRYTAASGALVFASGTNLWAWGLAVREPNPVIQQITYNLLADMGQAPATPAASLVLDGASGPPPPLSLAVLAPGSSPPPRITNVSATPTDFGVTVRWATDRPAAGQVWITRAAGQQDWAVANNELEPLAAAAVAPELALSHTLTLRGLAPGASYYAQVAATDAGRQAVFLAAPGPPAAPEFDTPPAAPLAQARQSLRPGYHAALCAARAHPAPWLLGGGAAALVSVLAAIGLQRRRRVVGY